MIIVATARIDPATTIKGNRPSHEAGQYLVNNVNNLARIYDTLDASLSSLFTCVRAYGHTRRARETRHTFSWLNMCIVTGQLTSRRRETPWVIDGIDAPMKGCRTKKFSLWKWFDSVGYREVSDWKVKNLTESWKFLCIRMYVSSDAVPLNEKQNVIYRVTNVSNNKRYSTSRNVKIKPSAV